MRTSRRERGAALARSRVNAASTHRYTAVTSSPRDGTRNGMDHDGLLQLIGEIYDAAADVSRWPQVLQRVADAFDAEEAALGMVSPVAVPWLIAPRSDPEFLRSYGEYYHSRNLFWRNMSRLPVGTGATDTMVLPKSELQASEFYNDWSKPQGFLSVLGATLFLEDGWRTEFV